jgi:HK97 family phage prohead protease
MIKPEIRDRLPAGSEVRSLPAEVELSEGDGPTMISGYAAVWDSVSQDLGGFVEVFEKGAFTDTLGSGGDVVARYNHDALLGRLSARTLRLYEDEIGLRYDVVIPRTTLGRDLAWMIRSKNVAGSSFCFQVLDKADEQWSRQGGLNVRRVRKAALYDVGPVDSPAYLGTIGKVKLRHNEATAKGRRVAERDRMRRLAEAERELDQDRKLRLLQAEASLTPNLDAAKDRLEVEEFFDMSAAERQPPKLSLARRKLERYHLDLRH